MWQVRIDQRAQRTVRGEPCNVCRQSDTFTQTVEQPYLKIFGLNLFPLKKELISVCTNCQRRKTITPFPEHEFVDEGSSFKYYRGWVVLAVLIGLVTWLYFWVTIG